MMSYPPTPAFGGFPLPAPKGPPGPSQDSRKLSINSVGSSNTTLLSPAIQSPNHLSKFPNDSSASRQPPFAVSIASPNQMHAPLSGSTKQGRRSSDGAPEDREEGELSDAEDLQETHISGRGNHSGSKQQDRGIQNHQGREFTPHGSRINGEAPNHSSIARSQTRNEPYRRESTSQGWNQQGLNRRRSFELSSVGPPKASRGEQHDRRFDPPSQPKGSFRDRKSSGPGNVASSFSGPKNPSPFHSTTTTRGTYVNNNPVHSSAPQFPLETPKTTELRIEAQRAVSDMLLLKVTFKYMTEEAGIDANVLKKVFTGTRLPIPTETPSPSPSGDVDHPHRGVTKHKSREKSSDKIEIDKEAQSIRKQLEKDARDRERREAEAKAAKLARQREAAEKEEEEKKRRAEVEAKKEVFRRKIDEMNLPGKSTSPGTPLTPISSTPVMEAIAKASTVLPLKPEMPRIPGLLLGQLDGCYSDTPSSPENMSIQCDVIMKDSPEPTASQSSGHSTTVTPNISTGPAIATSPEHPPAQRKKRPVASDMYSEPATKRKFGDQRKVPIELIIDISEEEEEEEEEEEQEQEEQEEGGGSDHTGDDSGTSRSTPSDTDSKKSPANGNNSPPRLQTAPIGVFAANGTQSKLDSAKALQDKEEQIRNLKEAIQKAQQMKKMRAKTGVSTPTPVGTPTIGTGPSIPPPLTQKQKQQQVADVAIAISSSLDNPKMEDEMTRQQEEKQKVQFSQASQVEAKEFRKREKEEKLKTLLIEIKEIEKIEAEKRKKKVEEADAAEKKRRQVKEEMERKLKEAEDERQKSRIALMKIRQEFERMQREESEMEAKKEALKAELSAMENAVEQTVDAIGEGNDEIANQAISRKKEEIEQLKKTMEESEVDQTNLEIASPSVSSIIEGNTRSLQGLQLAKPDVLEDFKSDKAGIQDDITMVGNVDTKMNGVVGTYQQSQTPVTERAEIAASHMLAVSLPMFVDNLGDAMDLDLQVNQEEKVNENDVYTDVDMDARSNEGGGQEDKVMSTVPPNEADEISEKEEEKEDSESKQEPKLQALDTRLLPDPISMTSPESTLPEKAVAPNFLDKKSTAEEANLSTSEPEQEPIEELVDPIKITSPTAPISDIKKQEQERVSRQPKHIFTPYKSPLTNFKSFRYHPNFLDFCPGGYKSLTFSNRIDPMKPLCRWELSGGICSDTSCLGQHQRQLEVPDDEILVELASVVEGSNDEERNSYNRGLRQAIATMREQGIKDFQMVVAGIASYRRRFLGDEARVLKLPYPTPAAPPPQQQRALSSFSSYT